MARPSLRITGGTLRGRVLSAGRDPRIRPTSARVRAAIFNVVGPVCGLRVADLYCGSGALGIEALSRGAESVVAVDSSRSARRLALANAAQLGPELGSRFGFALARVERWISDPDNGAPFDLVLLDPPYSRFGTGTDPLRGLFSNDLIGPDGLAVCEHPSRIDLHGSGGSEWAVRKTYSYGDTAISLLGLNTQSGRR